MTAPGPELDPREEMRRMQRQAQLNEKIEVLYAHLRAGAETEVAIAYLHELAEAEAELRSLALARRDKT